MNRLADWRSLNERQRKRTVHHVLIGFLLLVLAVSRTRNYPFPSLANLLLQALPTRTEESSIPSSSIVKVRKLPPGHLLSTSPNTTTTTTTRKRAVFYNIYIPNIDDDNAKRENALSIVKEQLAWKWSSRLLQNATLYYVIIGIGGTNNNAKNATEEQVSELCRAHASSNQHCQLLQSVDQGDESFTLQHLYNYCHANHDDDHDPRQQQQQQQQQPSQQVTYIHNKGSFHPSEKNDNLRAFLHEGIFGANGEYCQAMPQEHCNVCGTRFSTLPHYHFPGNMWTATCDYIQKLLPPREEFGIQMNALLERHKDGDDDAIPRPTPKQISLGWPVGHGRYAWEHWIGSHPDLQPCDIYPDHNYTFGYLRVPDRRHHHHHHHNNNNNESSSSSWVAQLVTAPRMEIRTFRENYLKNRPFHHDWITGEWFCGQARLWEYAFLYDGLQPAPDHWIWNYYRENFTGCPVPLLGLGNTMAPAGHNDDSAASQSVFLES